MSTVFEDVGHSRPLRGLAAGEAETLMDTIAAEYWDPCGPAGSGGTEHHGTGGTGPSAALRKG
ncbi:hypothetical protein [Phytomonospora endophytica]|uniref:Uncharacterized protein n=1 Tax=Phytomonospora endophytica TaxID=714109 RepID=A0A841FQR3_9ACTN|nr:hypothetical protein [Phytomonospora endophytica]MBB6034899.1 hypothetical protein [Phytomonospora endophytica]GIG70603.1 hypothetical protein Pen01_68980 [Phytomonospora endophytica]